MMALAARILLGVVLLQVLGAERAEALITRSCTGYFRVFVSHIDSVRLPSPEELGRLDEFTATGACGRLVANRCRRRAARDAMVCLRAHYAARTSPRAPSECRIASISGYDVEALQASLWSLAVRAACARRARSTVTLIVDAYVRGDTGCGGGDRSVQGYALVPSLTFPCPN